MYEYKSVELDRKGLFGTELGDYNEIINKHAKEGWRLVQILPIRYSSHGVPLELEIIFERKVDN